MGLLGIAIARALRTGVTTMSRIRPTDIHHYLYCLYLFTFLNACRVTHSGVLCLNSFKWADIRATQLFRVLYNTNFSRGGNFRYIRELGFCAKLSSRENNIHCEWNFAKFSSREIFLPRNFPPRENKILIAV